MSINPAQTLSTQTDTQLAVTELRAEKIVALRAWWPHFAKNFLFEASWLGVDSIIRKKGRFSGWKELCFDRTSPGKPLVLVSDWRKSTLVWHNVSERPPKGFHNGARICIQVHFERENNILWEFQILARRLTNATVEEWNSDFLKHERSRRSDELH